MPGLSKPTLTQKTTLRLIAKGYTDKEIASHRGLTMRGSEDVVFRMLKRYGFTSRVQLVVLALREGWITYDEIYKSKPKVTEL